MTKRFLQVLPYIFVAVLIGIMVLLLTSLKNDQPPVIDDAILTGQVEEFCQLWVDGVDCNEWAVETVEEYGEVMHVCLNEYAIDSMKVYECVDEAGVFD